MIESSTIEVIDLYTADNGLVICESRPADNDDIAELVEQQEAA